MTVRGLISEKGSTDPFASCGFLDCFREFLRCLEYCRIVGFWYIRKMIDLDLRHDECVSESLWRDIEKCIGICILIDPIGGDFLGDDAREEGGHSVRMCKFSDFCHSVAERRNLFRKYL